jgi:nucleoside-diphosphate-sugar epimerase
MIRGAAGAGIKHFVHVSSLDTVIHAAAETAGGWPEHQRNSLDATEHMIRGRPGEGVRRST